MKPPIDQTTFGSMTIVETVFERDALIRLGEKAEKTEEKLSQALYGTSQALTFTVTDMAASAADLKVKEGIFLMILD